MSAEIRSIPTKYAGLQMRSLLEAKWAAFFDQMTWPWRYEPVEFAGWIPDFVLLGKEPVYVEVKPIVKCDPAICNEIDHSGCGDEVLLLGLAPLAEHLGWLREGALPETCWGEARFWSQDARYVGFHGEYGSWHDRIFGKYDGNAAANAGWWSGTRAVVAERWASACNATQWKKRA